MEAGIAFISACVMAAKTLKEDPTRLSRAVFITSLVTGIALGIAISW